MEAARVYEMNEDSIPAVDFKSSFLNRASEMGLQTNDHEIFTYDDMFGSVMYKQLQCLDQVRIPFLSVYTMDSSEAVTDLTFKGIVSDDYKFVGHQMVISKVKDALSEGRDASFYENSQTYFNGCLLYSEMSLLNSKVDSEIGDVFPHVSVTNGYNGSRAITRVFGITIKGESLHRTTSFRKFGKFRQIHVENASVGISDQYGRYTDSFAGTFEEFINENKQKVMTPESLLKVLDLVEQIGKRKRVEISTVLDSEFGTDEDRKISNWDMFMAISRFSTIEKNLNVKVLLENITERCLVFPIQMQNVLKEVNKREEKE